MLVAVVGVVVGARIAVRPRRSVGQPAGPWLSGGRTPGAGAPPAAVQRDQDQVQRAVDALSQLPALGIKTGNTKRCTGTGIYTVPTSLR